LGPHGTAATNRTFVPVPGDYDERETGVMIGRGTKLLGENLPQRHFVHHKSYMTRPGFEPGPSRWEASDLLLDLWRGQVGKFFYYLVCKAICTAATPGLLCEPRVIAKMIVEKQRECRLAGETEILRENLPQRHLVHHKSYMTTPGFEPGPPQWETRDLFFLISAVVLWVIRPLTDLLYHPRMIGDGDCGEIGGMKIGRGNRNTQRKPAPAPLCPPRILYD
jgi:hypothetical protein